VKTLLLTMLVRNTRKTVAVSAALFALFAGLSLAQAPAQPPRVQSPEVSADGRVTFRLRAPGAQKVVVDIAGAKGPLEMKKDASGVWSATTDVMSPDFYSYSFNADGVRLLDPSNHAVVPNLLNPSSEVHVGNDPSLSWETVDVSHGTLHHHFYHSAIVGDNRDFYVYTPPGYDPAAKTLYPVLYLLHGYSDNASGWSAVGRANIILDNLISQKKSKPMLIVMPLGYGAPEIVQPTPVFAAPFSNKELRERNFTNFRSALIDEVIPQVEKNYRADRNREARAIAGLSMGGAESLLTGLNRPDKFSYVGAFSSGGLSDDFPTDFPQISSAINSQLHLLWIACGTEDRLITLNRKLVEYLKGKQIQVTPIETPGMHTWMVWRRNVTAFAPLLFQGASSSSSTAQ
jgi:enterochelin esterase-like enzyme